MADAEHLAKLKGGLFRVEDWNRWRMQNLTIQPDLSGADLGSAKFQKANLTKADLSGANLSEADLRGANLSWAILKGADLSGAQLGEAFLYNANLYRANLYNANLFRAKLCEADLSGANLSWTILIEADLSWAILKGAHLVEANLNGANLRKADLSGANLSGGHLRRATLVEINLEGTNLTGCNVYGTSVWNARLDGAIQSNLVVTPEDESVIQVDNLEVAQFIYLLLNNERIRHVIDTITSKVVLILGRFTPERKAVLDSIREGLRNHDFLPVLFDFEKPSNRDITETVRTLAHMARFIIADITDAKSIPQELMAIVPNLPSVPVQPLLLESQHEYGMFEHFRRYPWVLEPVLYHKQDELLAELEPKVIVPAEAKAKELIRK